MLCTCCCPSRAHATACQVLFWGWCLLLGVWQQNAVHQSVFKCNQLQARWAVVPTDICTDLCNNHAVIRCVVWKITSVSACMPNQLCHAERSPLWCGNTTVCCASGTDVPCSTTCPTCSESLRVLASPPICHTFVCIQSSFRECLLRCSVCFWQQCGSGVLHRV